jgi:hypothetical protein
MQKLAREVLKYLYAEYLKGPSVLYNISAIAKRDNASPVALSDYLLENLWIRDRWIYQNGDVTCKITIKGIEEVDPAYVRMKLKQVIGGLGHAGGRSELTSLLEINISEYSVVMDIIKQLDNLGLIKIVRPENNIVVELTELGWVYYEKGSRTFFTLMTY